MKTIITTIVLIMISICTSFSQRTNEDFNIFFFKFSVDSVFQIERIKFPLEFKTWEDPEEIGGDIVTIQIKKEDWKHDYFFMTENYRPQIFDNFEGELRDTDERLFQWIGIETGVNVKYFFKRIEGKWFLIKKENLGD
ncbi:MAG: DUF4348 domain-containing protein [Bacteroidales bacterium]|jgi:hypothetical protein|nr:DUF4348 domain-containing protein [Bacteroidales bacterium]